MMIDAQKQICPVCSSQSIQPLFESLEWNGALYAEPINVSDVPKRKIKLWYCGHCGFIQQYPQTRASLDYSKISRGTSKQLQSYTSEIVYSLSHYGINKEAKLIDIGSNDGSFLKKLKVSGYNNLLGIEPSEFLAQSSRESGFEVINDFFDFNKSRDIVDTRGAVAAVICRHTLEHVTDIKDFIDGISNVLIEGGLAYIEVPDTDWTINKLLAHEFWDEHISYFNELTLQSLLQDSGFSIEKCKIFKHRDVQNIGCWAVKRTSHDQLARKHASPVFLQKLSEFQNDWNSFSQNLRNNLLSMPRPYIALGASHVQCNFLNYTQISDMIDILIDDDPYKSDHYLYFGRPVSIKPTLNLLNHIKVGTVILSAFPYPEWQSKIIKGLAGTDVVFLKVENHEMEP